MAIAFNLDKTWPTDRPPTRAAASKALSIDIQLIRELALVSVEGVQQRLYRWWKHLPATPYHTQAG